MKALEKIGFAITNAGHDLDAVDYAADSDAINKKIEARKEYGKKHPFLGYAFMGNDPMARFFSEVQRNRLAYAAAKHAKKENAYNPFAGWSDASYEKNRKAIEKILGKHQKKIEKK